MAINRLGSGTAWLFGPTMRGPMSKSVQILDLNAFSRSSGRFDPKSAVGRRLANFGAASVLFYREPIEMVSARGAWITASDGTRYLDFYNNVPSVGHCHPKVVEAIASQAAKLNINTRYLCEVVDRYLEKLKSTLPATLSNVVMTCSGSEANDLALRIAVKATGSTGFVVTENAYHGNTRYVTDISPAAHKTAALPDHVVAIPPPELSSDGSDAFRASLAGAIAELNRRGYALAAFICDTILSSDGVYSDPAAFLRPAVVEARRAGGLFIADEVQPGFARTGEAFWGFERHYVTPDIVTMGKPMGNGYPMAAMATQPHLLEAFSEDVGYFNTFGGNPVAAAAGLAVLEVIREEGLQNNARRVGAYLKQRLQHAARSTGRISDIRGVGLFLGIDIRGDKQSAVATTSNIINQLKDKGILVSATGRWAATLKIRPPLNLTMEETDLFVDALESALAQ